MLSLDHFARNPCETRRIIIWMIRRKERRPGGDEVEMRGWIEGREEDGWVVDKKVKSEATIVWI